MSEEVQETGLLGGASAEDLTTPEEQQDTSINVFEEETPEAVTVERPEDLPEQFWDADTGTFKSNELYDEYKKEKGIALGLRQKLSKGQPAAAESPESYQLDAEKMADAGLNISDDDPGLKIFKQVAFDNGLDQEKFEKIFTEYMSAASNNKEIQEMNQPQGASEEQQQEYVKSELEKLGPDSSAVVQGIKNFHQQLFYDGLLSKEDFETAQNMGMSASEIRVINAYRMKSGDMSIPESPSVIDGSESEAEIHRMMRSPDYESDPVLQKKVSDFYLK